MEVAEKTRCSSKLNLSTLCHSQSTITCHGRIYLSNDPLPLPPYLSQETHGFSLSLPTIDTFYGCLGHDILRYK